MPDYDPDADGNAELDLVHLKPTIYVIGGEEETPHTHKFYLRTHLPLATTATNFHAHSIVEGPGENHLLCEEADGHIHTNLVVEDAGDYIVRTIQQGDS